MLATVLYSAGATSLLLKFVALLCPIRASAQDEGPGMDVTQHGEEAYAHGDGAILVLPEGDGPTVVPVLAPTPEGGNL